MADQQVQIRKLTAQDIPAAATILKDLWIHHAESEPALLDLEFLKNYDFEEYLSKFLSDHKSQVFVADISGEVVGLTKVEIVPRRDMKFKFSKSLEIDDMSVAPSHRHHGVGSLLLQECYHFAKAHDIKVCHAKIYSFSKEFGFFAEKHGLRSLYGDFYLFLD